MAKITKAMLIEEMEDLVTQVVEQITEDEANAIFCDDGSITVGVMCEYSNRMAADIFAISSRINRIEWQSVYTIREEKISKIEQ